MKKKDIVATKAISMALRYPCKDLERIYACFKDDGILFMEFFNIYLCNIGGCVGYKKDICRIAPGIDKDEFYRFVELMKKSKKIVFKDVYFYLPRRNVVFGHGMHPTEEDFELLHRARDKGDYVCSVSPDMIRRGLHNIAKEITAPLPKNVLDNINRMKKKYKNKNIYDGMRLTMFYLKHSISMIGMVSDSRITSQILDVDKMYLMFFIKDNPFIRIDKCNKIFYDSELRKMNGLPEVPQDDEIRLYKCNLRTRVDFLGCNLDKQ